MTQKGIIAAGHPSTIEAAETTLQAGGNAFDAVLAAQFSACVVEPIFTSLGGGGFLLAHTNTDHDFLYDFFTQTPLHRRNSEMMDFYPINADFGTTTQEFHIGMSSIATPGIVKGLFKIHRELCTLPIKQIIEPAVAFARHGVKVNQLQAYSFVVLEKILRSTPAALAIYRNPNSDQLLTEGELLKQPDLADALDSLANEGDSLFYRGDLAKQIIKDSREHGGSITENDLHKYRVMRRKPLTFSYHNSRVLTNPPPSSGGVLIAFTLKLLEQLNVSTLGFGTTAYLRLLARTMESAQRVRKSIVDDHTVKEYPKARKLLGSRLLHAYRTTILEHTSSTRGTTHISVIDAKGNMASMTTSNGEGSGYIIPNTGIMLNNMLGEEDINPRGFHRGAPGRRLSSMLSPTLMFGANGSSVAMGSGGSNRIRTAMLQVLLNLIDFGMPVKTAVDSPRIHFENGLLSIEGGFELDGLAELTAEFPNHKLWRDRNLFFGGVHVAQRNAADKSFTGAGDPRRGGTSLRVG